MTGREGRLVLLGSNQKGGKMNGEDQPQQSPARGPSKAVWAIAIIIVLLIIGGLVFYLSSRSKSKTEITIPPRTTTQPPSPTTEGKALPAKDVMGTDLEVAPRSPGSVRTGYSKSPTGATKITYRTKDPADQVKEYYYDKMTSLGWQMTSSEESQVVFEKEPARLYIFLYYDESDQVTEYELKYFSE